MGAPWSIETVELAEPREDEVLVRMVGVGICHTDLSCRSGALPVALPIVLGHEGSGVVERIGSKVTRVRVGDHVVLSFDSCGQCRNCRHDSPATCFEFFPRNFTGKRTDGTTPIQQNGALIHAVFFSQSSFATHAIAREVNTVVIDKDLPLELMGPLGCGIQTGAGAVANSLGLREGDSLAIFGAGGVGLSALLAARALGAGSVIVVEPNEKRARFAQELGATHVVNPMKTPDTLAEIRTLGGGGVNFAFDTTGIPAVIGAAVEALLPGGVLGMVGGPPPEAMMPANLMSMLFRGVTAKYIIEGDSNPQTFIPKMLDWYRAGRFPFDKLIGKFPFESINEAAHAAETGDVIKPVLVF
ncbi:NAD(P)-dependent alcohol dehydrogenase [Nevskia sp.]|uniref:NAD(P)-dependent alcohol dehydrogenase n=1 Tax=Nevskia sp. TaxID=1929292 RepID=UPI0025DD7EC3|nr:NAD(P)-dependent alcohol dehydrogenase [Nevskia sp.]